MSQWPTEVPILTANDMCKGEWSKGKRCCLAEWNDRVFSDLSDVVRKEIKAVIFDEVKEVGRVELVTDFNDSHPLALNARVWNRAMYRLGYTVNNPEKKPLKGVK